MSQPVVVVTGATGFLGRELVDHLLAEEPAVHLALLVRGRDAAEARAPWWCSPIGWRGRRWRRRSGGSRSCARTSSRTGSGSTGRPTRFARDTDWGKRLAHAER